MPAGNHNFVIETNTAFKRTCTWKDNTGTLVPLTGYTAKLQFRDKPGGTLYLELNSSNGGIILTSPGQIVLYATNTQTAALTQKKMVYDLRVVAPSGDAKRLLEGKINVSQGVTS